MRRLVAVLLALSLSSALAQTAAPDPALELLQSAREWEAQQRPHLARLALEKLLRSQPGHAEASRRLFSLEIRSGRIDDAKRVLEQLRSHRPNDPAVAELEAGLRLATQDRLRLATARRLYETARYDEAAQAMRELFPEGPPPGDYGLEYWRVIARSNGGPPSARAGLERMARRYPEDPRYAAALAELRKSNKSRSRAQAPVALSPAPSPVPSLAPAPELSSWDFRAQAEAALAAGRIGQGLRYLEQAVSQQPTNPWVRFDLAKLYLKLEQPQEARSVMEQGVTVAPEVAEMRYAAALVYSSLNEDERALEQLSAIPVSEQTDKTRAMEQDLRDAFARRRNGFFTAGLNVNDKPGTAGLSQYTAWSLPIEWRLPKGNDTYWTVHAGPVRADAGTVPADYDAAALFGQVQASGPASLANFPGGARQDAHGVDLGVAYETDRWRVDLGTTPIGFPVENIVGGVRHTGDWGLLSYRAALSRRPLTGSMLSYAGARDPVSGRVWGGVVSNGIDLALGYYGAERLSGSFSVGAQRLTGRNVKPNDHWRARAASDWALVDQPSTQVTIGLALTHWRYSDDLGEYTFGHGGYYSPQSYLSLALPVDWRGRYGRFGYQLRASGSVSRTREAAQDFYPNDPALQAQAAGSPTPSGFTQPVYDGGSGGGWGYTLKAALEYRVAEHWFLGGQLQMDRSEFYTPNVFGTYFRYDFDGKPSETPYPPRPPLPYYDY